MVTKVLLTLYYLMFMLMAQESIAQDEKREYEQSIKKRQVPSEILQSIEPFLQNASRIRYYFETDGNTESYEIKARIKKKEYSVEYRKDGALIDIEVLIDFEEIPAQVRNIIHEYLQEKYDRFVFTRVQQQYYPQKKEGEDTLEDFIGKDFEDFEIRYELEVDTRSNDQLGSFELLFNPEGKLIQERKIIRRTEDNIFY